jgi:Na+/H+-dicarboxylate symporter
MSLTNKILIGMVAGILVGILFNKILSLPHPSALPPTEMGRWIQTVLINGIFDTVGQIFIASLKLLVVPMVFVSLVCGAAALGGHNRMGVMATKTLGLYLITTAMAVALAIIFAVVVQPGASMQVALSANYVAPVVPSIKETFIDIFPDNPLAAMVEGNMLQVIVFSILFGMAISRTVSDIGNSMLVFFENLNRVILKMVMMLMHLAPYGVFCLLVKLFANLGWSAILDLAKYFFLVLVVLFIHGLGVYGLLLKILTGLNPLIFFRKMWKVMVFAFSTASSNATLPINLRTVEHDLGVDNKVASFSIPLGATINMDGTAIMQGVATVFIAQAYQIDIGIAGYLLVILTATLASIGTAGVPGVGLVTLAMVLQSVGLPVAGIAMIIGVDRFLDMVRTAVNVTGDSVVSVIVAKSEKMLNLEIFHNQKLNAENDPV